MVLREEMPQEMGEGGIRIMRTEKKRIKRRMEKALRRISRPEITAEKMASEQNRHRRLEEALFFLEEEARG
jgi:hypothetical protein